MLPGFFRLKNKESNSIKDFRIIIAANNERDGVDVGIWNRNKLLIEIFRDDKNSEYSISFYKKDLPLKLVEECIKFFKEKVPNAFSM
jgi:hypothetical protein